MKLTLRDLGIACLKEHLSKCKDHRDSLAREFAAAGTSLEQTKLAFRWDNTLKHGYMVQFLLELLERRENEGHPPAEVQHIRLKAHRHRWSTRDRRVVRAGATTPALTPRVSSATSGS
jgi:hypothetical protein